MNLILVEHQIFQHPFSLRWCFLYKKKLKQIDLTALFVVEPAFSDFTSSQSEVLYIRRKAHKAQSSMRVQSSLLINLYFFVHKLLKCKCKCSHGSISVITDRRMKKQTKSKMFYVYHRFLAVNLFEWFWYNKTYHLWPKHGSFQRIYSTELFLQPAMSYHSKTSPVLFCTPQCHSLKAQPLPWGFEVELTDIWIFSVVCFNIRYERLWRREVLHLQWPPSTKSTLRLCVPLYSIGLTNESEL